MVTQLNYSCSALQDKVSLKGYNNNHTGDFYAPHLRWARGAYKHTRKKTTPKTQSNNKNTQNNCCTWKRKTLVQGVKVQTLQKMGGSLIFCLECIVWGDSIQWHCKLIKSRGWNTSPVYQLILSVKSSSLYKGAEGVRFFWFQTSSFFFFFFFFSFFLGGEGG